MTTSFYNGVSGLMTFQQSIDIWGDNIANINTTGFKEKTPNFDTLFATTLTGSVDSDIGLGSCVTNTSIDTSQGSLINTDNKFDLAIGGDGWFKVQKGNGYYYTRDGAFSKDAEGFLVNDSGEYLLVANADNLTKQSDGSWTVDISKKPDILNQTPTPISLPDNVVLPAVPTQNITLKTNLDDDTKISSTTPASEETYFNALYNSEGEDLQMQDNQDLLFGFGNDVEYQNGSLSSTFCFNDDTKDDKDSNISFTLNSEDFSINIPDGSSAEDIAKDVSQALNEKGFSTSVDGNKLTIYTKDKFILSSNSSQMQNTAAAVLKYKTDKSDEFDFSTPKDFENELQQLADTAYKDQTSVGFENGTFHIDNLSKNNINAYAKEADNTNETFLKNLDRLGNTIIPGTSSKSLEFLSNTKTFSNDIIDKDGNKHTISFTFTKDKVLNNQTVWKGDIKIDGNETTQNDFLFDSSGKLISPASLSVTSPQDMNINFDLTSFSKTDTKTSYSYSQDGVAKGYLKDYQIDQNGNILALFSNNKEAVLGQIPVYHFSNDQGFDNTPDGVLSPTSNLDKAILFTNQDGYIPGAKVLSSTLEASNVNMSNAMTELIVTQKAFSASAKTVTTSDEMIQKAINLKR